MTQTTSHRSTSTYSVILTPRTGPLVKMPQDYADAESAIAAANVEAERPALVCVEVWQMVTETKGHQVWERNLWAERQAAA